MERNAHRLTLHSPAREILPRIGRWFIDFAQISRPFFIQNGLKSADVTTIYCDATIKQHHRSGQLTEYKTAKSRTATRRREYRPG
ncbi:hypothetical protein AHR24_19840 [Salmonella enterica subsp. diarizonae]|nr:hypothetical protein [Salmonella enterica subsp. diarizonae]